MPSLHGIFGSKSSKNSHSESPKIPDSQPSGAADTPRHHSHRTQINAFKFALETLSAAAGCAPIPGIKAALDVLLSTVEHAQRMPENASAVAELTDRIKPLLPFIEKMPQTGPIPQTSIDLLQNVERQFSNLAADIQEASSQGKLAQFFNSADNSSAVNKYIADIGHIIGELTLITSSNTYSEVTAMHGDLEKLRSDISSRNLGSPAVTKEFGNITGSIGGTGGTGKSGGEGGRGGGFKASLAGDQSYKFGDVTSGSGGAGGEGAEGAGGKGGDGGDFVLG